MSEVVSPLFALRLGFHAYDRKSGGVFRFLSECGNDSFGAVVAAVAYAGQIRFAENPLSLKVEKSGIFCCMPCAGTVKKLAEAVVQRIFHNQSTKVSSGIVIKQSSVLISTQFAASSVSA